MKRLLVLLAILLCCIPLASATIYTFQSGTNFTYAQQGTGYKLETGTWTVTAADLTAICGAAPYTTSTTRFAVHNSTTGWFGASSGNSSAYPRDILISETGADAPLYDLIGLTASCTSPGGTPTMIEYFPFYNSSADLVINADFTGAPTSGAAPLYVLFNDTSTNITGGETYNWTISPATGWLSTNLSAKDISVSFSVPGNYTISHGVAGASGSDIETKTDYITVYNLTTDYITTGFAAMDEPRWVQLAGATINLFDVENNSWKNTTASATGYEEITTLSNHTINAYASMAGYSDADLLSQPAWNGGTYTLNMYPEGYDNVSAGNVTLYVHVHGSDVLNVEGATVNIAYNYGGSQQNNYAITDESGFGKFVVPNQTLIYIYVEKVGYARAGTTQNSGNGNGGDDRVTVEITLQRSYVTTTPTTTVTTLPGGGTPTPTVTVDPYPCDADHPENCQRKQTDMANILVQYGPMLVMFFIALTIIGGVKQIGR